MCWVILHIQSTKLCTKLICVPPSIGLLSHCDQLSLLCSGHGVLATSDCIGILLVGLVKVSVLHSFDLLAGELCGMAYHLNRSNGGLSCWVNTIILYRKEMWEIRKPLQRSCLAWLSCDMKREIHATVGGGDWRVQKKESRRKGATI